MLKVKFVAKYLTSSLLQFQCILRLRCRETTLLPLSHVVARNYSSKYRIVPSLSDNRRNHDLHVSPVVRNIHRQLSSQRGTSHSNADNLVLSDLEYEQICDETLHSMADKFEELADSDLIGSDFDVNLSGGVITVKLGADRGTYVINKQTPNKQIWLSSPYSGPKRYDYVNGLWIYKHDGVALHRLLTEELSAHFPGTSLDFTVCAYGSRKNN